MRALFKITSITTNSGKDHNMVNTSVPNVFDGLKSGLHEISTLTQLYPSSHYVMYVLCCL